MYKLTLLLIYLFLACNISYAAFPVNHLPLTKQQTDYTTSLAKVSHKTLSPTPPPFAFNRGKNHLVAILLSILVGPLGAHNLYLGYYVAGSAQFIITALIAYIIATATGFGSLLLVAPLVLGLGIWLLVDIISIAAKSKLPKYGDYN